MGHRQAWVWQDEWFGLTMEDIRQLEEETRAILNQTMGKQFDSLQLGNLSDRESDQEVGFASTESRGSVVHVPSLKRESIHENGSKLELISKYSLEDSEESSPIPPIEIKIERHEFEREGMSFVSQERDQEYPSNMRDSFPRSIRSFRDSKRGSVTSYESASASLPPCMSRRMSCTDVMKGWQMTSIETSDSTSEDEFFDAQGKKMFVCNSCTMQCYTTQILFKSTFLSIYQVYSDDPLNSANILLPSVCTKKQ